MTLTAGAVERAGQRPRPALDGENTGNGARECLKIDDLAAGRLALGLALRTRYGRVCELRRRH